MAELYRDSRRGWLVISDFAASYFDSAQSSRPSPPPSSASAPVPMTSGTMLLDVCGDAGGPGWGAGPDRSLPGAKAVLGFPVPGASDPRVTASVMSLAVSPGGIVDDGGE